MALGEGVPRDVLLNMSSEVLGVALTVGIIGGLWHQLQTYSEGALEAPMARTVERRDRPSSKRSGRRSPRSWTCISGRPAAAFLPRLLCGLAFGIRNRRRLQALEEMLGSA